MEGSETGCGRVWTVVRMEDGGEPDGVWTGVDGGEDGRWGGSETGCGRVWTGVRMEDGGEQDGEWTGVDGGEDGRRRGARRGVDGCGQG